MVLHVLTHPFLPRRSSDLDPAVRTVGARPDDPGRDLGAVRPPPPDRGAAGARGACGSGAGAGQGTLRAVHRAARSEEHTSELQSLMRISYAVFCLKKKHNPNKI